MPRGLNLLHPGQVRPTRFPTTLPRPSRVPPLVDQSVQHTPLLARSRQGPSRLGALWPVCGVSGTIAVAAALLPTSPVQSRSPIPRAGGGPLLPDPPRQRHPSPPAGSGRASALKVASAAPTVVAIASYPSSVDSDDPLCRLPVLTRSPPSVSSLVLRPPTHAPPHAHPPRFPQGQSPFPSPVPPFVTLWLLPLTPLPWPPLSPPPVSPTPPPGAAPER